MGIHYIGASVLVYLKIFHNRKLKKKTNQKERNFSSGTQKQVTQEGLGLHKGLCLHPG